MSNTDTFIDEVSEEVRKDRLFGYIRKYGWIAVVVVLGVVGGTAFLEYRKAQATEQARVTGDAIIAALETEDDAARAQALAEVEAEGGTAAIIGLLSAANLSETEDPEGAVAALNAVAGNLDAPEIYREIAALKSAMIVEGGQSLEERRTILEGLATPGKPLRLLAAEQLALLSIEAGETEAALEQFAAIAQDAEVTSSLRDRAFAMIVALDGDIEELIGAFLGTAAQTE